jgi:hypothetical protein
MVVSNAITELKPRPRRGNSDGDEVSPRLEGELANAELATARRVPNNGGKQRPGRPVRDVGDEAPATAPQRRGGAALPGWPAAGWLVAGTGDSGGRGTRALPASTTSSRPAARNAASASRCRPSGDERAVRARTASACVGERSGLCDRKAVRMAETTAAASLVPLARAGCPSASAASSPHPGATRSTPGPRAEKAQSPSCSDPAPTLTAAGIAAGCSTAPPPLPVAATTEIPSDLTKPITSSNRSTCSSVGPTPPSDRLTATMRCA